MQINNIITPKKTPSFFAAPDPQLRARDINFNFSSFPPYARIIQSNDCEFYDDDDERRDAHESGGAVGGVGSTFDDSFLHGNNTEYH